MRFKDYKIFLNKIILNKIFLLEVFQPIAKYTQ